MARAGRRRRRRRKLETSLRSSIATACRSSPLYFYSPSFLERKYPSGVYKRVGRPPNAPHSCRKDIKKLLITPGAMQSKHFGQEEESGLLSSVKHQGIQRAYSDSLQVTDPIIKELDESLSAYQAEIVVCECCGMSEDCTPTYISRIKEKFCGKWVCGLCSEAVKEQLKRIPPLAMDEALESHMSLCKKFNRTVRLNPKLSLAGAMRDIAKKSSEHRTSYHSCASKIVRTFSCNCA